MTPPAGINPLTAAQAYDRARQGGLSSNADFASTLQDLIQSAIRSGQSAEAKAAEAITGQGNLTDVVTAISHAEITLQTATAIRDRVVQAYQDIMKMPI